ncbi:DNA alkylation repair protein [Lactococcus allomyrinae]|uniref:DNA alkylation repair protein n=1 Tax=Lactococcus allomyrinae TaxID=2419773 RepID=A0A387BJJ9_9LACT|nr:DNA alkylation repair protein [Lactococcus allomyrinae]AYG01217.1 DNA alkylation repair protein [Lactococcus allomyrinae]
MQEIVEIFRVQGNQEVAEKQAAYLRHQFEFIGLKTPVRRQLQKVFLTNLCKNKRIDWSFVWKMWQLPEREFQYLAADYLIKMKKYLTNADLFEIKKLAVTKSWWETVDTLDELVGHLLLTDKSLSVLTEIEKWAVDDNFWVRRLAIDCQLGFKEKTDTVLLESVLTKNLSGSTFDQEFFINKAIGWALRDFSKTDADWVREFITTNGHKMSKLSYREASKYL